MWGKGEWRGMRGTVKPEYRVKSIDNALEYRILS